MRPRLRLSRAATCLSCAALTGLLALSLTLSVTAPAGAGETTVPNPVTPGNFTGYGFDQCLAPDQLSMDRWLNNSPFFAVGIYISGDSRGCREQPNLTPEWVSTQLLKGWRLLPITLGPQASCSTRFPRYDDDVKINGTAGANGKYDAARNQGVAEAVKTVNDATALGLTKGSTLWYDLEAFDSTKTACRESALAFLSGWCAKVRELGFKTGVYSSAGSGIKVLDDARINRPTAFTLPDYLWIARWDGEANTHTTYISDDGWNPHRRVKQYMGGHDETWGGVTINIDRNWLDVGLGTVAPPNPEYCGGVQVDFYNYKALSPGSYAPPMISALQCLLRQRGVYSRAINGRYTSATIGAVKRWQQQVDHPVSSTWSVPDWYSLLTYGTKPVLKFGSASHAVRRLQRAINIGVATHVEMTGVFDGATVSALREWQKKRGLPATGVAAWNTWARMD